MLELKKIHKTYKIKGAPDTHALVDINLKFPASGLVFVLGKSGCGKSTLLNVMGGLDRYDSGEIIIKGKSSEDFKGADFDSYRNTYLGFIFQEYNVIEEFTIERNIALALDLQHKKSGKADVDAILHEVELDGYNDRYPNQISGGQKQRVAIARALIKSPQIILADEPTGALDSATGIQIFELLKKLSKDKLVVVVSHDREFAEGFGDRVIELKDGRVISDITKVEGGFTDTSNTDIIDGVSFLRDGAKILAGTEITEKHLGLLNERLRDKKEYTISIVDDKQKLLSEDPVSGSGKQFVPTDNGAIAMQAGGFKLIKSKLPGKDARRIAGSSLKHKRVRLAFTIILSLLSVAFFGFSDMVGQFDKEPILLRAMTDYQYKHIRVENSICTEFETEYGKQVMSQYYPFSDQKLSQYDSITDSKHAEVIETYIDARFVTRRDSSQYYGETYYSGIAQVRDFANFGLDIPTVYGRAPRPGTNEVAISNYMAECYMELGMVYTDEGKDITKNSFEKINEIVNYELKLMDRPVVITGIINFNIAQFYPLKTAQNLSLRTRLGDEYRYTLGLLYGAEGILDYIGASVSINNIFMLEFSGISEFDNYHDYYYGSSFILSDEIGKSQGAKPLWEVPVYDDRTYYYYGDGKTEYVEPKADEILLHAGMIPAGGISSTGDPQTYFDKYASIIGKTVNIDIKLMNSHREFEYNIASKQGVKIIGLYYDMNYSGQSIVNRGLFDVVAGAFNPTSVILYTPDRTAQASIMNDAKNNLTTIQENVWTQRQANIPPANMLRGIESMFSYFVTIFLVISLVFAFFSVLLILNFISASISYKKKEIGILRALGARKMDVLRIFLWEGTFIGIWVMAFASVIVFAAAVIMNALSVKIVMYELVLVLFDIRQLLLMLLLTAGTIGLASALPVGKISSKNPIDAIRARNG